MDWVGGGAEPMRGAVGFDWATGFEGFPGCSDTKKSSRSSKLGDCRDGESFPPSLHTALGIVCTDSNNEGTDNKPN
jgi:hypothetical protein